VKTNAVSARRRLMGESGSQLLEFAMVLPILLMIIAAIAEFGVMFRTNSVVANAAREGARIAAIPGNEENNYETARARIAETLTEGGLAGGRVITITPESVTIATSTVAAGVRVTVAYTHTTLFMGPIVAIMNGTFAQAILIQSTAVMRTEIAAVAGT
jgi:Flp pilus assembly protein TadG